MKELEYKRIYLKNNYEIREYSTNKGNIIALFSNNAFLSFSFLDNDLKFDLCNNYLKLYDLPNYLYNCGNAVNLEDIVKTNTPTFGFITIPFRINKERYLRVGPTLSFDVFGNITGSVGTYQVNDNNHYGNIFDDDLRSLLINNSIYVLKDFRRYREELDKRVSEYFDDDLLEKKFEYFIEDKKLVKKKVEKIENEVNKEYYNDNNLIFYQNHMEEVVYEMCYTKGKDSKRRNR